MRVENTACRLGPDWLGEFPLLPVRPGQWNISLQNSSLLAQDLRLLHHLLLLSGRLLVQLPPHLLPDNPSDGGWTKMEERGLSDWSKPRCWHATPKPRLQVVLSRSGIRFEIDMLQLFYAIKTSAKGRS